MTEYVTADTHFGHQNIIKYCNRPWKNSHHMDKALIENWNAVVGTDDTTYVLGDFAWWGPKKRDRVEQVTQQLNGTKILILGNHDQLKPFTYVELGFQSVHTALKLPGNVYMFHDPALAAACPKDALCLCGHVHNLFRIVGNAYNVGVDIHNYQPIKLNDVYYEWAGVESRRLVERGS